MLLLLYARGPLRRGSLAAAPPRAGLLEPADLAYALALVLAGASAATIVVRLMPGPDTAATPAARAAASVLLGQVAMLPLLFFIVWRVCRVQGGACAFGLSCRRPLRHILLGLLGLGAALPVVLAMGALTSLVSELWIEPVPRLGHEILEVVAGSGGQVGATVALMVGAVIAAPLAEELIYRGLVQTVLLDLGGRPRRWLVVITASAWFTLIHAPGAGTGSVIWQSLPSLFVLALFLGWLYERTGCLWPSIVLHMGFNAANFVFVLLAGR